MQNDIFFSNAKVVVDAEVLPPLTHSAEHNIFQKIGRFDRNNRYPRLKDIKLDDRLRGASCQLKGYNIVQVKHLKFWKTIQLREANLFYHVLFCMKLIWLDCQSLNHLDLQQPRASSAHQSAQHLWLLELMAAW
ncbi:MAG: hypothetical protein HC895_05850 [Leptolyngbyaceae cyanobacterium SM1_3_5]|nr:hypothetical protein [Leptolyngbyaceae cyanobacterium SM1_3_5]